MLPWLESLERRSWGGAQVMDRKWVIVTSEASRVSKGTMVGNLERRATGRQREACY